MQSTFTTQPGQLMAYPPPPTHTHTPQPLKKKKKKEEPGFPLLKRYVFYLTQVEVEENAQEQNIMVG